MPDEADPTSVASQAAAAEEPDIPTDMVATGEAPARLPPASRRLVLSMMRGVFHYGPAPSA